MNLYIPRELVDRFVYSYRYDAGAGDPASWLRLTRCQNYIKSCENNVLAPRRELEPCLVKIAALCWRIY
jgi:hypothetical protein